MEAFLFAPYQNVAAWQLRPNQRPLVVAAAPYGFPPPGHVVVRVQAIGVNPVDWIVQGGSGFALKYPTILGEDLVGEIVEVGDHVHGLRTGSRVIACANVLSANDYSKGAFQKYVVVQAVAVAELPDHIAPEQGVVLPLPFTTAAAGLYQQRYLALPFPSVHKASIAPINRTVLIWGGSSAVGSSAIQLCVASGAKVIATASPRNFDYCRNLGASQVFDYHDRDIEDVLVDALEDQTLAGIYHAAGDGNVVRACARIAERCHGKALVVTVRPDRYDDIGGETRIEKIAAAALFEEGNTVGQYIWREYLPAALANGSIVPAPEPLIVGQGLRSIQAGLDRQKKGVSAAKVVVNKIDSD